MAVLLFFGAVVLLAVVLKFVFTPRSAKKVTPSSAKKIVKSSNPIDGIRFGGVMGFMLGDSFDFCWSRFKHLNIDVDSIDKTGANSMIVAWGKNTFNNVNEARFIFESNKLVSIVIDIDFSKEGIKDMYGILVSRICRILGVEPYSSRATQSLWGNGNCQIALFRHLVPISETENLLIQIR